MQLEAQFQSNTEQLTKAMRVLGIFVLICVICAANAAVSLGFAEINPGKFKNISRINDLSNSNLIQVNFHRSARQMLGFLFK